MLRIYLIYIKKLLRTKSVLFWNLTFPILLGTLFYFAFSNIYGDQSSSAMKICIVGENAENHPFTKVLQELTYENGSKMMDITFSDEASALEALKDGDDNGNTKAIFGASTGEKEDGKKEKYLSPRERAELIEKLTAEMKNAAKMLEFEYAADLRDKIARLKKKH